MSKGKKKKKKKNGGGGGGSLGKPIEMEDQIWVYHPEDDYIEKVCIPILLFFVHRVDWTLTATFKHSRRLTLMCLNILLPRHKVLTEERLIHLVLKREGN